MNIFIYIMLFIIYIKMNINIGIIGKNNTKGLGAVTRNFINNLPIKKVMIIIDDHQYIRHMINCTYVNIYDVDKYIDEFLIELDMLILLEIPFQNVIIKCKTNNIKTVLLVNYEYLPEDIHNIPDMFLCSSSLNFKYTNYKNKILLPVPIDEEQILYKKRTGRCKILYHQTGTDGMYGFNGTNILLDALKYINKKFLLIINEPEILSPLCKSVITNDDRVIIIKTKSYTSEYNLYKNFYDFFICLQNIRATSLPIQEAMLSGLPIITTDIEPFNEIITDKKLLVPINTYKECELHSKNKNKTIYKINNLTFFNKNVKCGIYDAKDVGKIINNILEIDDISKISEDIHEKSKVFTWKENKNKYLNLFNEICGKRCGPSMINGIFLKISDKKYILQYKLCNLYSQKGVEYCNYIIVNTTSTNLTNDEATLNVNDDIYDICKIIDNNIIFEINSLNENIIIQFKKNNVYITNTQIISCIKKNKYVIYIGNFENAYFSTENQIAITLEKMNYGVIRLQENKINIFDVIFVIYLFHKKNIHFVLYTRTWKINGNVIKLWKYLKYNNIPTVSYHLDLYVGISREKSIEDDPFWKTEYVFSVDGDKNSIKLFKKIKINYYYLNAGIFYDHCYLSNITTGYKYDIIFVGSTNYHIEWTYRKKLLNFLSDIYGSKFNVFGGTNTIRGDDLNKLYMSSKIVIGDTLCMNFNHEYYWSDRVYETIGRGGFIIHPYIKGLDDEFINYVDIVFYKYDDLEQLKYLIDYYLVNSVEREKIRYNGFNKVKEKYTYNNRMTHIIDILSKKNNFNNKINDNTNINFDKNLKNDKIKYNEHIYICNTVIDKYMTTLQENGYVSFNNNEKRKYILEKYDDDDGSIYIKKNDIFVIKDVNTGEYLCADKIISKKTKQQIVFANKEKNDNCKWILDYEKNKYDIDDDDYIYEFQNISIKNIVKNNYLHSHYHFHYDEYNEITLFSENYEWYFTT
jgi:hypothetical protein